LYFVRIELPVKKNNCFPVQAGLPLSGHLNPNALKCANIVTSLMDLKVALYLFEAVSKKRYSLVFNFDIAPVLYVKYRTDVDLTIKRLAVNSAGKAAQLAVSSAGKAVQLAVNSAGKAAQLAVNSAGKATQLAVNSAGKAAQLAVNSAGKAAQL
jgi:hypothetical protein